MISCRSLCLLHNLIAISRHHPTEAWLLILLFAGFIFNSINQPIFWHPAKTLSQKQVANDIHTCTSPADLSRNDVTCPLVNERMRKQVIFTD